MRGYLYGYSTQEHTVEAERGTIREGEGELIGDDAARCDYCSAPISGDEDGWYHVDDREHGDPD